MIDKKEVKKLIFEKCIPLINHKGFNSLGVKEITDIAGMSKGSFYNYFPSKEQFGVELINYYSFKTEKLLRVILFDDRYSVRDRFLNAYHFFKETYESDGIEGIESILGAFSVELSVVSSDIKAAVHNSYDSLKSVIEEAFAVGLKKGEIYSHLKKDEIAEFLLISWYGAILRMRASDSFAPFKLCLAFVLNIIFVNGRGGISADKPEHQQNSTE